MIFILVYVLIEDSKMDKRVKDKLVIWRRIGCLKRFLFKNWKG